MWVAATALFLFVWPSGKQILPDLLILDSWHQLVFWANQWCAKEKYKCMFIRLKYWRYLFWFKFWLLCGHCESIACKTDVTQIKLVQWNLLSIVNTSFIKRYRKFYPYSCRSIRLNFCNLALMLHLLSNWMSQRSPGIQIVSFLFIVTRFWRTRWSPKTNSGLPKPESSSCQSTT